MECEKVRDRFSSLWEKELSSVEEEILKEHLSSCPKCQAEFGQFGKTMQWLHSAGDVEVPEGFLPELHKKLEQKKRAVPGQKLGGRWLHFPLSFKLPVQAVAMVAVVFLVLYLTKMIPTEGIRLKEAKPTPSPLSVQERPDGVLSSKEVKREPRGLEAPPVTPRPREGEQLEAPVPRKTELEKASVPQMKAEAKKRDAPPRSAEVLGYQAAASKEAARADAPSPEPGEIGKELAVQGKTLAAAKSSRQIILRTSDREKVMFRLNELVKQFGGEVMTTKGDMVLASLPTGSFSEFEKELAELSSPAKADALIAKKDAVGSFRFEQETKREASDEKSKGAAWVAADTESRTIVRILLVEE